MGLSLDKWVPWILLGTLTGILIWALGLGRGFERGLDQGVQALETGQVQLVSTKGGFEQYFFLISLVKGIPGVQAVSPRMEFPATVTNGQGKSKTVTVRAFNFVEEDQVTEFQKRVTHGVSGPISGLLIPQDWEEQSFAFPSEDATLTPKAGGTSESVPVTGTLERVIGLQGQQYAFLDLGTARSVLGDSAKVTTLVIRLRPGVDPKIWVKENLDSFRKVDAQIESWDEVSQNYRARVLSLGQPLFLFRTLTASGAFLGLLILGWKRRFLTKGSSSWTWSFWLGVGASALTFLALSSLFPLWEGLLTGSIQAIYPFLENSRLPWGWGWEVVVLPLWSILFTLAVSAWRPVKASDSQFQSDSQLP